MDNFTINNNAQFDNISISANGNKEVKNNVIPKETSFPQQHPQNKIYGDGRQLGSADDIVRRFS